MCHLRNVEPPCPLHRGDDCIRLSGTMALLYISARKLVPLPSHLRMPLLPARLWLGLIAGMAGSSTAALSPLPSYLSSLPLPLSQRMDTSTRFSIPCCELCEAWSSLSSSRWAPVLVSRLSAVALLAVDGRLWGLREGCPWYVTLASLPL